ncbi:hypothetical protein QJS10_CPB17g01545 [Acorus calamus]|uniref:Glycine-rich protein n=1 Tax=Acorus calamus TaxID=4465 RepID=A0AAV9CSB2_ACOCL|nr:hypothetical protein QJS10_CPB17g01545 [Acorus calamus]
MKLLLHFFMLFLVMSLLLPLHAIPLSRSLTLMNQDMSSLEMIEQEDGGRGGGGALEVEELGHGRMDLERNDYPGSGANNRHDPRNPGRP